MKKSNQATLFAFKLVHKKQEVKTNAKWQVRQGVSIAGCSGRDARAADPWRGRDAGA